jgi:hypothetical protein
MLPVDNKEDRNVGVRTQLVSFELSWMTFELNFVQWMASRREILDFVSVHSQNLAIFKESWQFTWAIGVINQHFFATIGLLIYYLPGVKYLFLCWILVNVHIDELILSRVYNWPVNHFELIVTPDLSLELLALENTVNNLVFWLMNVENPSSGD